MADQEFELTAKLRIRMIAANDAKDLQTYCFAGRPLEEIEKELKQDLDQIKKGRVYRIVAEASGHAIGNIRLERSKADEAAGELSQLIVSPPFRKFEVADRLVEVIEQIASENELETVQIELPKSESAIIEAYKKWGFAERPVVTLQKAVAKSESEDANAQKNNSDENSEEKSRQQKLL